MLLSSWKNAPKERVRKIVAMQRITFTASLAGIAALGAACGGSPNTAKLSPSPTSSPSNLNIKASLPAGTEGTSYTGNVAVSGGTAPYNFAVVSGQLPQGVNLSNSNGNVSGTPSAAGSFNFAVSVSDSTGVSKQQSLQITVAQAQATSAPAPTASAPAPAPTSPPPSNPPPSGGSGSSGSSNSGSSGSNSGSSSGGTALSNLQRTGGWGQYGQGPPSFVDCSPSPCDGIDFSMTQGVSSPSLSGNSTVYWLGGTNPYSDALWNNHLIGTSSTQGMSDDNQSLTPSIYNFTYDVDFYGDQLNLAQALEFDINQFFDNMGFIFGHECRVAGGNQWDIWDNSKNQWIPTGIPCYPNSGQWNHLTLKVQRTSDNHETYQSITLNGQTSTLNWTFDKGPSPGWFGVTVNFQLDGNYKQDQYKVYLDNLTLTYQ